MENSKFGVNTIISLVYIKRSCVSLLEPQQNNFSNSQAYPEPCQTTKMECFARLLTFFVKHSILDVCQSFEYASVICYSLFGKFENAYKIDLVAV